MLSPWCNNEKLRRAWGRGLTCHELRVILAQICICKLLATVWKLWSERSCGKWPQPSWSEGNVSTNYPIIWSAQQLWSAVGWWAVRGSSQGTWVTHVRHTHLPWVLPRTAHASPNWIIRQLVLRPITLWPQLHYIHTLAKSLQLSLIVWCRFVQG